ncbi:hypothetical protein T484DRAFT_3407813 [Baffinella frigidus]|nr:hypothetical protein T484DRAFT_3407813 [Cryptophyta sp. CCMP2293]
MGIKVDGIFVAPAASLPMEERDSAELIAGKGISGDRYASQTGTYSVLRVSAQRPGEREPGRQITLLSADSVDAALARAGLTPVGSLPAQNLNQQAGISKDGSNLRESFYHRRTE